MKSPAEATARPWGEDETRIVELTPRQRNPFKDVGGGIVGPSGEQIIVGGSQDEQGGAVGILRQADRELILEAVNSHDTLLAMLAETIRALSALGNIPVMNSWSAGECRSATCSEWDEAEEVRKRAESMLTSMRGEK